jgi:hypothetical protein
MNKTVDLLYDNINNGYFSLLDNSVINDYFGNQINKENYDIIYGVYESLIILKGISKNLIEHCYLTNRLDELIYKKHINIKTDYYNLFMKNNIIIGSTFFYDNKTKLLNIYDDNHCPSCNANNYLKSSSFECYKCLNTICSLCSFYDEKNNIYTCNKCENPNLETVINKKITECKKEDKIKFNKEGNINFDDIKELLRKQKFKCYICNDMILTSNWLCDCLYHISISKIIITLPHNRDNVLISCHYCNNNEEKTGRTNMKICKNKCHNDNRNIISNKNNIPEIIINQLKLNKT